MTKNGLTARENRVIDLSTQIRTETSDDIAYQHVVLCHLGFPRSRTATRTFERTSGRAALSLEAGKIWDGFAFQPQPLPYGAIPRLMMIACITRAIQQKSPVIELGRSMRESLRLLGFSDTGAAHWRNVAAQQRALAAVRLTLGYTKGDVAVTVDAKPFNRIEAWVHRNPDQLTLEPSVIEMSAEFYNTLGGHSVPLDPRGVAMLNRYPLALDVYCWLAHRLYRVRNPRGDRLPWMELRRQFGLEITDAKNFKRMFRAALKRVLMAYPAAKITSFGSGIVLHSSPPPIARTQSLIPYKSR